MTVWVCSKCGVAGAQPSAVRPSLDDRYAVGWCSSCTPPPSVLHPYRKPAALIRSDLWDANELRRRAEADAMRKLLRDFGEADDEGRIRGTAREGRDGVIRVPVRLRERGCKGARIPGDFRPRTGGTALRVTSSPPSPVPGVA